MFAIFWRALTYTGIFYVCVRVFVCVFFFSLGDGDGLVGGWQSGNACELPNEEQVEQC